MRHSRGHGKRYVLAALIALVLSLAVVFLSIVSHPDRVIYHVPDSAQSIRDHVTVDSEYADLDDDWYYEPEDYGAQMHIYNTNVSMKTLFIQMEEPLEEGIECEVYATTMSDYEIARLQKRLAAQAEIAAAQAESYNMLGDPFDEDDYDMFGDPFDDEAASAGNYNMLGDPFDDEEDDYDMFGDPFDDETASAGNYNMLGDPFDDDEDDYDMFGDPFDEEEDEVLEEGEKLSEVTEEYHISLTSSYHQNYLVVRFPVNTYYYILRVVIDGQFHMIDLLATEDDPVAERMTWIEYVRSNGISAINWSQWLVSFLIFLLEGFYVAGHLEKVREHMRKVPETLRSARFYLGLAIYVVSLGLSALAWQILCGQGSMLRSPYTLGFFLLCGSAVGGVLAFFGQWKEHPERSFFVMALSLGLMFACLFAPAIGYSWDEDVHFRRAVALSYAGVDYATSADLTLMHKTYPVNISSAWNAEVAQSVNALYAQGADSYFDGDYTITQIHQVICYLPYGAGMWLGRVLGLTYTGMIYLSRSMNVLFYVLVMTLAIRRIGKGKMLVAVLGIIPEVLFMSASFAYDPFMLCLMVYGFTVFLDEFQHPDKKLTLENALKMMVSLALGFSPKQVYVPLMLIILFLPKSKFPSRKHRALYTLGVILLICILIASVLLPFTLATDTYNDTRILDDVDAGHQTALILDDPLGYLGMMFNYIREFLDLNQIIDGSITFYSFAGSVLNFACRNGYLVLLLIAFLLSGPGKVRDERKVPWWMKLGTLILSAGTLCLVCTALYISFSSVGAETIDGVQPRYLLPMMLTSLLMLKPNYIRNPIPDKWYHGMMLLGMCVVSLIGMHPLLLLLAAV